MNRKFKSMYKITKIAILKYYFFKFYRILKIIKAGSYQNVTSEIVSQLGYFQLCQNQLVFLHCESYLLLDSVYQIILGRLGFQGLVGFGRSGWVWQFRLDLVGQDGFGMLRWVCLHWLILPCVILRLKVKFLRGVVVQFNHY